MNILWLIALLNPGDVPQRPTGNSEEPLEVGPGHLAMLSLGKTEELRELLSGASSDGAANQALTAALKSIQLGTVAAGSQELESILRSDSELEVGALGAFALCCSVALAELDSHARALALLDEMTRRVERETTRGTTGSSALLRAALLQQRAMRLAESGEGPKEAIDQALGLLRSVRPSSLPSFETSGRSRRTSSGAYQSVVDDIRMASANVRRISGAPRRIWMRSRPPARSRLTTAFAAETIQGYTALLSEHLQEKTSGEQTWHAYDPVDSPVWRALWHSEVVGDLAGARRWRRELGQLRIVRADTDTPDGLIQDALRLLRHADDAKASRSALSYVQASGPLKALRREGMQVVERVPPSRLGELELRTINFASQVLTSSEAGRALDSVLDAAQRPAPPRLGGVWQASSMRVEQVWEAAVSLGPVCSRQDEVALDLLGAVRQAEYDLSLDHSFARVLGRLDFSDLKGTTVEQWRTWLAETEDTDAWSIIRDLVAPEVGAIRFSAAGPTGIGEAADLLNQVILNRSPAPSKASMKRAGDLARRQMAATREKAAAGSYRIGGLSVAEIAVGLSLYAGQDDLWPDLIEFLADSNIARIDKGPALNRLANEASRIPSGVRDRLGAAFAEILNSEVTGRPFELEVDPFPAAVRLGAALALVGSDELLTLLSRLAGGTQSQARVECARVISAMCRTAETLPEWAIAIALGLTRDQSVNVRAEAARALALMLSNTTDLRVLLTDRLEELLREDGVLVPLLALRGLTEAGEDAPLAIEKAVQDAAQHHPAFGVRLQAKAATHR